MSFRDRLAGLRPEDDALVPGLKHPAERGGSALRIAELVGGIERAVLYGGLCHGRFPFHAILFTGGVPITVTSWQTQTFNLE